MIYKLIDTNSFYKDDEPVARIVVPGDGEGLTKKASHSDIDFFVSTLEPKNGKMYLHINAMGAGEYYGSNKNGDYFPEEQLIQYHKTFEEHGYVYRHHINKDPAKSMGRVIFAIYNHAMHRVELIAEVDKELGADILGRLEAGDFPFTSMACKTPFDVCSICGNRAHTRQEYCDHLTGQLNKLHPDGRKVMALNLAPLRFFDISIVIRPADITSSVLRKVAEEDGVVVGSAEVADAEGLGESHIKAAETLKQASMNKLADIIKTIDDGVVTKVSDTASAILDRTYAPATSLTKKLISTVGINQAFNALADANVSPDISWLAQLIHEANGGEGCIQEEVNHALGNYRVDDIPASAMELVPDIFEEDVHPWARSVVREIVPGSSLSVEQVEKRAMYWEQLNPTATRPQLVEVPTPPRKNTNLDYVLALIGAALVGKFILNNLAKQKNQLKLVYGNQQVKTASASLLPVVNVLLDSSELRELSRFKH